MIDRYDRRMVLLVAQFAVMAVAGVFALLVGTGAIAPWSTLVLVAAYGTACRSSSRPAPPSSRCLSSADLANAVALNACSECVPVTGRPWPGC